jgi:hypothetical protein
MRESPRYAEINSAELREIEAELGHPVTRELAQWFIRNRTNREAVERMIEAADSAQIDAGPDVLSAGKTAWPKVIGKIPAPKKRCA